MGAHEGLRRELREREPAVRATVLPGATGDRDVPPGRFVTALDGVPLAHSHGHGHAIDWL